MTNETNTTEEFAELQTRVELISAYQRPEHISITDLLRKGPDEVSVTFNFCEKGFGFGEFRIKQTREGVFVDTEAMGVDKLKHYLGLLLDSAITDVDNDPELHRRYCEAMNRQCGPACPQCGGVAQLKRVEAQLAERLGLSGNVREQLVQLSKDNQLSDEDELVSDWLAGYAWYLEWRKGLDK